MLSFGEIIIVILVALLVVKPADIPIIIKKIHQLKSYFTNIKTTALSYVTKELDIASFEQNPEHLNFYLQKIINIQGFYDGEYNLTELKAKYNELVMDEVKRIREKEEI